MTRGEIEAAIPHRDPFLLLDAIVEQGDGWIVCKKRFAPGEYFYRGHYPRTPVTPGVLLCEAAMQAGGVLMSHLANSGADLIPVVTRMNNVKFKRMVLPGEEIEIRVDFVEQLSHAFFFRGKITCAGQVAVQLEFVCTLTKPIVS